MTRGVKSTYLPKYAEQARKLCLLGATDKEMADIFGVALSTLNKWKLDNPDFSESIKKGKDIADGEVADRLYQRAMGYSHAAVKIFNDQGAPLEVEYTEHYPPDTAAAIFWLKNRQRGKWRDKQEVEQSGTVSYQIVTGIPERDDRSDD